MNEYISKQELFDKTINKNHAWLCTTNSKGENLKEIVEQMPPADVRINTHGHWQRRIVDNGFNADWICSECGHREYTDFIHMNFCPNCGADMRGEK